MRTSSNSAAVLFGQTRRAVLSLLFTNADQRFYLREIARRTGVSVGALQRELKQLVKGGILLHDHHGFFSPDTNSPIYEPLKQIVVRTMGVADQLRLALRPIEERITFAFVFGSFARGDEQTGSDVDLMIIAAKPVQLSEITSLLRPAQEQLAREVNPFLTSKLALAKDLAQNKAFTRRVVEGPKVWIQGDTDEFERLAQEWLAQKAPTERRRDR